MFDYVVFASYGNDSVALIQYLSTTLKGKKVAVLFSDTGWAAAKWAERVEKGEAFARSVGFMPFRTESEGMEALVKRKKGWPMGGGGAFCTAELKVLPALAWLNDNDPDGEAVCCVGIRREESANRASFPEYVEESEKHGGRSLYAPLVRFSEAQRNELLVSAGFPILPMRSKECFPCVHANINDLRQLDEASIVNIERIENEMGINSKGNPRVMFRPKRHQGAVGIREVIAWANKPRKTHPITPSCDSGYCGD